VRNVYTRGASNYHAAMLRNLTLAAMIALLGATAAVAQNATPGADSGMPVPAEPDKYAWVGLIVAIVLSVGVIVASVMSAKRGHQD
jgi:hypothetical protein